MILCGTGSFICYFYVGVFKYVGNFSDFLSERSKCSTFALFLLLNMLMLCLVCFKGFFSYSSCCNMPFIVFISVFHSSFLIGNCEVY